MAVYTYTVILSWIVLACSIDAVSKIPIYQPMICVKEKFTLQKPELIKTSASSFKDFVQNSEIFVDKTLLANIATLNSSFVSLNYPRKWGKSIILDMLKTFLEMEVDLTGSKKPLETTWAYKFFTKGEIEDEHGKPSKLKHAPMVSKNEHAINSYLGQYPVIYLDLSSFTIVSKDFDVVFKKFQKRIADAFRRHEYMIEAFRNDLDDSEMASAKRQKTKKLLDTFKRYEARQMDSEKGMITSLEFLSSILKSHFKRHVYILIDDYDFLVREIWCEMSSSVNKEVQKIVDFFHKFFSSTFEVNENLHMGIVTGTSNFNVFGNHSNHLMPLSYNILSKNIHPFYGFTTMEVSQLLGLCVSRENTILEAKKFCISCHIGDFPDILVYDPSLIVNVVNQPTQVHSSVDISSLLKIIPDVVNHPSEISFDKFMWGLHDVLALIKKTPFENEIIHSFFTRFYAFEYFISNKVVSKKLIVSKNIELQETYTLTPSIILRTCMEGYYGTAVTNSAKEVVDLLLEFFQLRSYQDYGHAWPKLKVLSTFYEAVLYDIEKNYTSIDSNIIRKSDKMYFAHLLLLLHMKMDHDYVICFNASSYVDDSEGELKPVMVLYKSSHFVIFELECGHVLIDGYFSLARKALNRAKRFQRFVYEKFTSKFSYTFIGIGLNTFNCKMEIQIDTNPYYSRDR